MNKVNNYVDKSVNKIVVNDERIARFVAERVGSDDFTAHGTIGVFEVSTAGWARIIAGIVYDNFNGANVCMHVAARPGTNWMSRRLLRLAFGYPFEQLGCRRVTGLVPETNARSRRLCEQLGFEVETRIRAGAPDGDVLVYSMFRQNCRWVLPARGKNVTNWSHSEKGPLVGRGNSGALSREAIPIKIDSNPRLLSHS